MQELGPGLWTWTAPHPSWNGQTTWGPDVRSYLYDAGTSLVLFDPLSPPSLLDTLVEAQEIAVVLTAAWHRRSADECVERFGAHVYGPHDDPPADVERRRIYYDAEAAYWLPRHRALVVGDAFLAERGLQVQDEWLPQGMTREQMYEGLRPLTELPVELLLVTHGDPVVEDAYAALRGALES